MCQVVLKSNLIFFVVYFFFQWTLIPCVSYLCNILFVWPCYCYLLAEVVMDLWMHYVLFLLLVSYTDILDHPWALLAVPCHRIPLIPRQQNKQVFQVPSQSPLILPLTHWLGSYSQVKLPLKRIPLYNIRPTMLSSQCYLCWVDHEALFYRDLLAWVFYVGYIEFMGQI